MDSSLGTSVRLGPATFSSELWPWLRQPPAYHSGKRGFDRLRLVSGTGLFVQPPPSLAPLRFCFFFLEKALPLYQPTRMGALCFSWHSAESRLGPEGLHLAGRRGRVRPRQLQQGPELRAGAQSRKWGGNAGGCSSRIPVQTGNARNKHHFEVPYFKTHSGHIKFKQLACLTTTT